MAGSSPNLFIVGAPKCGTSAIYSYVSTHPNIYLSRCKEPHYFSEDCPYRSVTTRARYLELFRPASARRGVKTIGEASTTYLHTPGAIERIREFAPDARIVVAVRNPLELVVSMHSHLLYWNYEDVRDFGEAWGKSDGRQQGLDMPNLPRKGDRIQLCYKEIGRLGAPLDALLKIFPRNQVHVVVFDDLRSAPIRVYKDLLTFLEIPYDGRQDFPPENITMNHARLSAWTRMATNVPLPILKAFQFCGLRNRGIVKAVTKPFTKKASKPTLSPAIVSEMRRHFAPDVQMLSALLHRDLTRWVSEVAD